MVGYLFFGSIRPIYEKGPFGVSLCLHSDSLNMNDTEFTFIGLIKSNDERSYLGTNPSFLRFVKYVRMEPLLDVLQRLFVTLFEPVKMKRGTHPSLWGN